ncbi:hypothetical protein N9L68_01350 [bacterium]|nr:hypothetical protein [bacterium]
MASLPMYETKKPTGGRHLLGIYKNRRLLIELRRVQKMLRFKRKLVQTPLVSAASEIEGFNAHVEADMELEQFCRLKSASIMTLCYHARYVLQNQDMLISKLKGSEQTKIEMFCQAMMLDIGS